MCECLKRVLEGSHRLVERSTADGPGTGLLAVGHRLVPHLAPQGMMRQAFDLVRALPAGKQALRPRSPLGSPLGRQRLDGLDQARVQPPPSLQ